MVIVYFEGEWKTTDDGQTYNSSSSQEYVGGEQRMLRISSNIKYDELVEKLYSLLCIDRTKMKIDLSCRPTTSMGCSKIPIHNDDDVGCFVQLNLQNLGSLTPLVVTKNAIVAPINGPLPFRSASGSNNFSESMPARIDELPENDIPQPITCDEGPVGHLDPSNVEMPMGQSHYVPGLDDIHTGSDIGIDNEEDPFG